MEADTTSPEYFMGLALLEAEQAGSRGEIPCGAVIVRDREVIASACNDNREKQNPIRHAEIIAIEKACDALGNERLGGCTLYVTKEPCAMCAGAIIHSRIEKVYIGARDEKYGACGSRFDILGNAGFNHTPEIIFGICGDECTQLIKTFFSQLREKKKNAALLADPNS
jgi:tRNA(adenine34) deaminase